MARPVGSGVHPAGSGREMRLGALWMRVGGLTERWRQEYNHVQHAVHWGCRSTSR